MKKFLQQNIFAIVYEVGGMGTFIYLAFFDDLFIHGGIGG